MTGRSASEPSPIRLQTATIPLRVEARRRAVMRWGLSFAAIAVLHAALAFAFLQHDAPPAGNEAPEAAIMIDLPPELALPPAESVESVAAAAAEESPPIETGQDLAAENVPAADAALETPEPLAEPLDESVPTEDVTADRPADAATQVAEDLPPEQAETTEAAPPDETVAADVVLPIPRPARPRAVAKSSPPKPVKPRTETRTAERRLKPEQKPAKQAIAGRKASGASQASNANALSRYKSSVRAAIVRQLRRNAESWAGRSATVKFTITGSGRLTGIAIVRSSGEATLDQAALSIIRRASPVAPIPAEVGRSALPTEMPVNFN